MTLAHESSVVAGKDSSIDAAGRVISSGQITLARMRLKMAAALFGGGACFLIAGVLYLLRGISYDRHACSADLSDFAHFFIMSFFFNVRVLLWALAPTCDDMLMMRFVMLAEVFVCFIPEHHHCLCLGTVFHIAWLICNRLPLLGFIPAICCKEVTRMRTWMWRTLHVWCWTSILLSVIWSAKTSIECGLLSPYIAEVPPRMVVAVFAMQPRLRQHYHTTLMAWLEGRSQARAAAAVAGLVGSCKADEVIRVASSRFKTVELAALQEEDLADNVPDPTLYARSSPARLNECDAFISHSWHDDAGAKWAALQQWRQRFLAEHGREPRVWLDKCCIDQGNIETDLLCLPIFLGGCRKMVVLCGPTYLRRLWCILEVFTFVHMGRKLENLEFELVLRGDKEDEDLFTVENALEEFDAEHCSCHVAEDKDRMLNIVLSAFGSLSAFNRVVGDMFNQAKLRDACATRSRTLRERHDCGGEVLSPRPRSPSAGDMV